MSDSKQCGRNGRLSRRLCLAACLIPAAMVLVLLWDQAQGLLPGLLIVLGCLGMHFAMMYATSNTGKEKTRSPEAGRLTEKENAASCPLPRARHDEIRGSKDSATATRNVAKESGS